MDVNKGFAIGPSGRTQGYGVLAEVSPRLLAVGAVWVLLADAVFTGMALHAGGVELVLCVVSSGLLLALLFTLCSERHLVALASLAAAIIFGELIYHISNLLGFTLLIALEIGVMHYCALRILARIRQDMQVDPARRSNGMAEGS